MPKIDASLSDLRELIGVDLSAGEIEDLLLLAKAEVDELEGDFMKIDFKDTNRPDLWSVEGAARQIKYFLNPSGLVIPRMHDGGYKVIIREEMRHARPYTVAAVVKGLAFNEHSLSQLIQLQEKLSQSYGRKRKEIAIGVYDLDRIKWPITFKLSDDERFVPLGFDREMSPGEILKEHPKGKEYGHLLEGMERYPMFVDAAGNVLSMPPIINSEYSGKVVEETRNVFIEASGFSLDKAMNAVRIIAHALYDRGGKVYAVEMEYPDFSTRLDFSPRKFEVDIDVIRDFTGLGLSDSDIIGLLRKYGYVPELHGRLLNLLYPSYREDIIHWRDVAEDVLIAYGYNSITPEPPEIVSIGGNSGLTDFEAVVREVAIGLGFQEVMTFVLSNPEKETEKSRAGGEVAEIANPVSSLYSCLRRNLFPSLLEFEGRNQHVSYPHRIFESGDVVELANAETGTETRKKVCMLVSHDTANYGEITGILAGFMNQFPVGMELRPKDFPFFIPGRSAEVVVEGRSIGFVGEINPEVLLAFGVERPVALAEIYVDSLMDEVSRKGR